HRRAGGDADGADHHAAQCAWRGRGRFRRAAGPCGIPPRGGVLAWPRQLARVSATGLTPFLSVLGKVLASRKRNSTGGGMAWGLKSVRNRRDDALSRIGWDRLESLLAEHYRQEGYQVEHVGTGGSGRRRRFDGGIDLKLRKDDAYVLVQSKHWNVYQVTHNAVHELLGLMVNEGATGAILVTSGEFTRAAIEAATRHGHVQLVDGDGLRAMLGPVPEIGAAGTMSARASDFISAVSESPNARRIGRAVNERLVSEVEGLERGGR